MTLVLFIILLIICVVIYYILTREQFAQTRIGATFPGTSYLTFEKGDQPADDFSLQVTFQTSDPLGGVLYSEPYSNEGDVPGSYHLCVEYNKVTFYAIQVNPVTKARTNVERFVLENSLSAGVTYTVTLEVNGNTLTYKEKDLTYPLRNLFTTGPNFYVGGPSLTLQKISIPAFKGCIYALRGPNGFVNFSPDHDTIKVGQC